MKTFVKLIGLGVALATVMGLTGLASASRPASGTSVYYVPVPARLQAFAQFRITDFNYVRGAGKLLVTYTLPAELTGVPYQRLEFEGNDSGQGHFVLSGEQGSADCQRSRSQLQCKLRMKNLRTNRNALSAILRSQSSSQAQFNSKLEVAMRFSGDPIGIVTYFY
jgi:hypothetical protein